MLNKTFKEHIILSEHVYDPCEPNKEFVTFYKQIHNTYKVTNMKLSKIKQDDIFMFEPDQKPKYLASTISNDCVVLDNIIGLIFIVLKRNKKSVKCRMLYGRVDFVFKFDGVFNNYEPVIDYNVQLLTPE